MSIKIDVKLTAWDMYEYMMYHTYRNTMQGLFGIIFGCILIGAFFATFKWLYLIAGVLLVGYIPVALYFSAKKQIISTDVFKETMHYTMNDEGVSIDVLEQHDEKTWDAVTKVVSTRGLLIIYTNRVTASLFPKSAMGNDYEKVIELIKNHVEKSKIKVK